MQSYKEYPIRCKTCGEQLAAFASEYETLLKTLVEGDRIAQIEGLDEEETPREGTLTHPLNELTIVEIALNRLGITEWCSRIAMMNPTIVTFNMENRAVIEGIENIDAAIDVDSQIPADADLSFALCRGPNSSFQVTPPQQTVPIEVVQPAPSDTIKLATSTFPSIIQYTGPLTQRIPPNAPGLQQTRLSTGSSTQRSNIRSIELQVSTRKPVSPIVGLITPVTSSSQEPGKLPSPSEVKIQPIEAIDLETGKKNFGVPETGTYQVPTIVGVPTINKSTYQPTTVNVGASSQVISLTGRTYLAH